MSSAGVVPELEARVLGFFQERAASFGLERERVGVGYVLNPGGFVNHSFRVRDGSRRLHLKLCRDPERQAALRRWHALGDLLADRHRAPRLLDWIVLGDAAGLLFEHLEGVPPPLSTGLLGELLPWHHRLTRDEELREALSGPAPTAFEIYRDGLHDRATEDLAGIRAGVPDFLEAHVLEWMAEEAALLFESVRAAACFDVELRTPVHADLWMANLLQPPGGPWYVLDWDEMAIGDPVLDLATLTGPSLEDLTPLKLREVVEEGLSSAERERLDWLGRATLLDWIIDPLADWIEAVASPGHVAEVRADKERQHRSALELYGRLYGGSPGTRLARVL